ncbi:hypothetical protein CGI23_24945 [Vibrio parahaemolyticus]|uniref:hypothetical protein n=1 Tax=Vibrio parahaemolyticus TaxID=670 RepID=UPI0011247A33|nr:hypothetical protein [Vibrio parahaemolyticus]TOK17898.1 hypothetical protein CGI23_24945 [Vibrio parahaemolyticus]
MDAVDVSFLVNTICLGNYAEAESLITETLITLNEIEFITVENEKLAKKTIHNVAGSCGLMGLNSWSKELSEIECDLIDNQAYNKSNERLNNIKNEVRKTIFFIKAGSIKDE